MVVLASNRQRVHVTSERRARRLFTAAAVVGIAHALPSLYWAMGGTALGHTLGEWASRWRRESPGGGSAALADLPRQGGRRDAAAAQPARTATGPVLVARVVLVRCRVARGEWGRQRDRRSRRIDGPDQNGADDGHHGTGRPCVLVGSALPPVGAAARRSFADEPCPSRVSRVPTREADIKDLREIKPSD